MHVEDSLLGIAVKLIGTSILGMCKGWHMSVLHQMLTLCCASHAILQVTAGLLL